MIINIKDTKKVAKLYEKWSETCVTSALQGVMGDIYAPAGDNPDCAVVILGDFAFYAGNPNRELVMYKPPHKEESHFIIMVGDSPEWDKLFMDCYKDKCKLHTRYAIKKDTQFSMDNLMDLAKKLPAEYSAKCIDEKLYYYCMDNDWCRDFVGNFADYEDYRQHGMGVMILHGDEPVAGTSSYSYYLEGIEIEIVTREDYRRKGLATVAAAKLIMMCLDKGLYPSWDAANLNSVGLSRKLGYEFDKEYTSYEVNW